MMLNVARALVDNVLSTPRLLLLLLLNFDLFALVGYSEGSMYPECPAAAASFEGLGKLPHQPAAVVCALAASVVAVAAAGLPLPLPLLVTTPEGPGVGSNWGTRVSAIQIPFFEQLVTRILRLGTDRL